MGQFKNFGAPEKILLFLGIIYAITSKNPGVTLAAVITPFILMVLLWKKEESPLLFMAFLLQWLSISIKVFYSNFEQLNFDETFEHYKLITNAFYCSIAGLISVAIGIHVIIRRYKLKQQDYARLALNYDSRKLVPLYIIVCILYPIVYNYSYVMGGLQQPISKLADFKWMVFFIFMLSCLYTKQWKLFSLIALMEIVLSLTGFFSNFKDYFLVIFAGLSIIFGKNLKLKQVLPLVGITAVCLYMIIIWQYVKPEYRNYLSGGQLNQSVVRTTGESLNKLSELVQNVDQIAINQGFKATVDRISYIDFFSATMEFVPASIPHTHGRLWGDAIGRVLQPRLFFPEKTSIDDSEITNKYAGVQVSGRESATSISLGYMTENYIDFGIPGMFISLFCYGLIIGFIYKYAMTSSPNKIIGTAMIIPFFILIYQFESALNKLIGGMFMYLIIYELIRRFVLDKFLNQIKAK
ncbi:hypothetical protein [Pedobacter nototheniae]|uniref:hypothetical protein n=1 Tax=Pedobacter nototheniae TaxID=2488994 RepID=UPI001039AF8B|nr:MULTISPECIES: hypothetical protein [Pedobacter]